MFFKRLFDYFFKVCVFCKKSSSKTVCDKCELLIRRRKGCFKCIKNCLCSFSSAIPFVYDEEITKLILRFKYNNETDLARFFAEEIAKISERKNYVFVPVPTTHRRILERGYNQAFLIACELKDILGGSISYETLKKSKYSLQKGKTSEERIQNAKESIVLNDVKNIINKDVAIVDDVISSGGTIQQCIDLIEPYAKSITVMVAAKT